MVRAGPSLSCSPRRVMVSTLSWLGTSTDTPVACRISWIPLPLGPIMYLCWDFLTSTDTVWHFLFYISIQVKVKTPQQTFYFLVKKKIKTYSNGKCIKIGEIRSSQCGIKWDIYSKVIKYQGIIDINLLYKKYYLGFPPIMFVTVDGSSCYT